MGLNQAKVLSVIALSLAISGWLVEVYNRLDFREVPFAAESAFIELVSAECGARVLVFSQPPACGRVLAAAGIDGRPPEDFNVNTVLSDQTRVRFTSPDNDNPGKIKLEPMSACAAFGLGNKMNLNQASLRDLELLPGIGPVLARRILEDRKINGDFRKISDLDRVKGIGRGKVHRLEPYITVGKAV